MIKNEQVGEVGDRRQPPSFVPKKVCFESVINPNVVTSNLVSSPSRIRIMTKKSVREKLLNWYLFANILFQSRSKLPSLLSKLYHCFVPLKVTFNETSLEERIEFEDDDESKHGRKLYWEFFAVDRCRFKDRIERLERVISPVLASSHRNVVYSHRIKKSSSESSLSSLVQIEEVKLVVVKTKSEIK